MLERPDTSGRSIARVLRKRAGAPSENCIPWVDRSHSIADRLDLAGQIHPGGMPAGSAQSEHEAHDVRNASRQVPIPDVQSCGSNAHEDFAGSDHGHVNGA
jgi:hypothetical protein